MGHPYCAASFKEPLKMTSLHVEYRPTTSELHYVVRWAMWFVGVAAFWGAADLFMRHGLDDPQTRRSMTVVAVYWLVWLVRYVSVSLRHVGD